MCGCVVVATEHFVFPIHLVPFFLRRLLNDRHELVYCRYLHFIFYLMVGGGWVVMLLRRHSGTQARKIYQLLTGRGV